MHDRRLTVAVLGLLSLACVPLGAGAEDGQKKTQRVFVEVCVVEVSPSKVRSLGYDWRSILESFNRTDEETRDLLSFVDSLAKDNLARVLCHPQITTLDGRTASFQVGDEEQWTKLEFVPEVLETQKIQLQFRLDLKPHKPGVGHANAAGNAPRQLLLDTITELEPGKGCCVSETRTRKSSDGKTVETATIVLVRADVKLPPDDREAAKRLPLRGYKEVPKPR